MTELTSAPGASGAALLGLGHYRPDRVVSNADLIAAGVDTDDEWIRSRVGISERRWAADDETIVDMAEAASSKAMAAAGVDADQIDLVLAVTSTMPTPVPAAAPQLADRLGIRAPGAYDISSGCSGFVYGLGAAQAAVRAGQARNVLVCASERFSGWLDMTDRSTCIILADGAGAAVVGAAETPGLGPIVWGSEGDKSDSIAIDVDSRTFRQDGQAVYRWVVSTMSEVAERACAAAGIAPSELGAFVPHQANLRIIDHLAKALGVGDIPVGRDIVTSGNTSAASIPLALSRMTEAGEIGSGVPVLLLGFGSGLAYAGQVVVTP